MSSKRRQILQRKQTLIKILFLHRQTVKSLSVTIFEITTARITLEISHKNCDINITTQYLTVESSTAWK